MPPIGYGVIYIVAFTITISVIAVFIENRRKKINQPVSGTHMNIYSYFAAVIGALSVITLIGWIVATRLDKKYGTEQWYENRFEVVFHPRETMPRSLRLQAKKAGISPEQLIRQFISEGMKNLDTDGFSSHETENQASTQR